MQKLSFAGFIIPGVTQKSAQKKACLRKQEKNEVFLPTARPLNNRWWGRGKRGAKVEVGLGRI